MAATVGLSIMSAFRVGQRGKKVGVHQVCLTSFKRKGKAFLETLWLVPV